MEGVDKLFKVQLDTDKAYEAELQGLQCFKIHEEGDAAETLKSFYNQGLEPGYTYVPPGALLVLHKPLYNPTSISDLEEETLKKGSVFIYPHISPFVDGGLGCLSRGFVVVNKDPYTSQVEYSLRKARAREKAPEYSQATKWRYGRLPVWWFGKYANIIYRYLDLPIFWVHGWGTWDGIEYNYERLHSRIKTLFLSKLREGEDWYDLMSDAAPYIHGAELHQKDNFRSSWARDMRHECELLGIAIPNLQKQKQKQKGVNDE